MADQPAWEDVKKLLDDPNVSDEKKRQLTLAYAQNSDEVWGNGINDEVEPYLNKYDDGYWRIVGENFTADREENLEESYKDAKSDRDKAAKEQKEHDKAVEDGKDALDDSQRKAENGEHGGAGAKSADELLDAGKPGLKYFENWIPLYEKIQHDYEDKEKALKLDAVHKLYDQQRQLDFQKFAKNIDDLNKAEKGMRESMGKMSHRLGGLWKSWTGGASQASQEYFSSKFNPTAQERVIATVSDAASMTQDTVKNVAKMVRDKAEATLKYDEHAETIAKKANQDWDTTIQVANGTDDDTTLREACTIWGIKIDEDCGDLTDEARDRIRDECHKMVRTVFAKTVEDSCENFKKLCDDTKKNIDDAWKKLNTELGQAEANPFQNPGPASDGGDKGGGDKGGGQQGVGPSGGGPSGSGAAGGGPSGGGGSGAGGGGGAPTPDMPKSPEAPEPPKPPEMPVPSGPGTSGGPGAPGQEGEKVTLGEGEKAITLHEPGTDGKTQIELVGPDGQPKTYAVDFSAGEPGQVPGQPIPGQQAPGQPAPGQPGADPVAGGQRPVGPQPIPVQPGPDGTAIIHEGDRTIILEQGQGGEIKVNVDNGGGQPPLNQTVDFGEQPPAPAPGAVPPEAGVGGPVPGPPPPAPDLGAPPEAPAAPAGVGATPAAEATPGDFAGAPAAAGAAAGMPGVSTMPAADASGGPPPGSAATTVPQSSGANSFTSGEGVQNSFGSASGSLFGDDGQEPGGRTGSAGLSSLGGDSGGPPQNTGSTGLSSLGGDSSGGGQQGQSSSAMGGGMMGGGMMGGAGQGQGGDEERTNDSPWRTEGQLFDDGVEASSVRFRSVLGEDQE